MRDAHSTSYERPEQSEAVTRATPGHYCRAEPGYTSTTQIKFVGIDVSKAALDFACLPNCAPKQSCNCLNPILLDHGQQPQRWATRLLDTSLPV
jgi:hypothetical protein